MFFGGLFLEDFLRGILCLHCRLSYSNLKGIDAFVKILSQKRRKEGGQEFRSLEVRRKLIALKKKIVWPSQNI